MPNDLDGTGNFLTCSATRAFVLRIGTLASLALQHASALFTKLRTNSEVFEFVVAHRPTDAVVVYRRNRPTLNSTGNLDELADPLLPMQANRTLACH